MKTKILLVITILSTSALIAAVFIMGDSGSKAVASHCDQVMSYAKKQDQVASLLFKSARSKIGKNLNIPSDELQKFKDAASAYYQILYSQVNYADKNSDCYSAEVIAALKPIQNNAYNTSFKWLNISPEQITNGMVIAIADGNAANFKNVLY